LEWFTGGLSAEHHLGVATTFRATVTRQNEKWAAQFTFPKRSPCSVGLSLCRSLHTQFTLFKQDA
ncbi:MAG TPA: hypothetical protein VE222_02930, partial [Nitrospiraceae bacterium]|nr:hypothetical protein [Nitrospiraceae bacterium]